MLFPVDHAIALSESVSVNKFTQLTITVISVAQGERRQNVKHKNAEKK